MFLHTSSSEAFGEGGSYSIEEKITACTKCLVSIRSILLHLLFFLKAVTVGRDAICSQCTENRFYWASELVTLFSN